MKPEDYKKSSKVLKGQSQHWKLTVMIFLTVIQIVLLILMIVSFAKPDNVVSFFLGFDGSAIGVVSVAHSLIWAPWFAFALRCPKCKRAMVWHIMKNGSQNKFVPSFVQMLYERCPSCGAEWDELSSGPNGNASN
ncbi:MAG: hypothetical protein JXX14_06025 [Deltaproteobacteria bacterium]|nr:hypothetical protein [Deltaproteobacteria bacterium]